MLFINQLNPYYRIYVPTLDAFIEFKGGRLEMDESHPAFETVKAEALRNPSIVMLTEAVQCPRCGEPFTGKAAAAQLGKHKKDAHFEDWVADKQAEQEAVLLREVKSRQPYACDLCPRVQEFGDAEALAVHVKAVHASVEVDSNGNVLDSGDGGEDRAIGGAAAEPPEAAPAAVVK